VNDDDIERLDEFLLSDAVGDDAMLLSELDGFLTGLVVGPEPIMPSEWMPMIWGEEGVDFEDDGHADAILSLIMNRYNEIAGELDRGEFGPIYDVDGDDSFVWEMWLDGFWRSILLRPEEWLAIGEDGDEDLQTAIFSLTRLYELATTPPGELEAHEADEELEKLAPDVIPYAVDILYRARLATVDPPAGPAKAKFRHVGRNDPCPCGSGKKFKKCCLQ
jgi:uncharacterized protein